MSMDFFHKVRKISLVPQFRIDLAIVFYGIGTAISPLTSLFPYRVYRCEIYPVKTHFGDALELGYSCAESPLLSEVAQKYLIDRTAFLNHGQLPLLLLIGLRIHNKQYQRAIEPASKTYDHRQE
ncbi:MAG: hypothetical protein BWX81_01827 [Spirochaetes bacterium ADurb.Bin110]|nr:MAG: hypothetical protein BWX81_01827 [Spirochaetes bacterium ADurb.Bin110]